MIEFIFLDLDNTILDFNRAEDNAIRKTLKALTGYDVSDAVVALYCRINRSLWEALERGEIDRESLRGRRFELLFEQLGVHPSVNMAKNMYDHHLSAGHYFVEGAPAALATLSRKYSLYLVSNGSRNIQEPRLDSSGIRRFFKGIFLSQDIGAEKPDIAFFNACFEGIPHFDPKHAIIVGDSLTADIKGGIHAGMTTCWFNPKGLPPREDITPDYTIAAWAEFSSVLRDCDAKNA